MGLGEALVMEEEVVEEAELDGQVEVADEVAGEGPVVAEEVAVEEDNDDYYKVSF